MVSNIDFSNFKGFFQTGIPNEILYSSFLLCVVLILFGFFSSYVKDKKHFVFWSLFVEYILVVLCSTVVCRSCLAEARIEPMPFGDYIAIANRTPGVSVWDIILNVVLFLPLGFLLSAIKQTWNWQNVLLSGFGFSFCIESMQFIFSKGIAQTDDLMHNSLGTLLGYFIFQMMRKIVKSNRNNVKLCIKNE